MHFAEIYTKKVIHENVPRVKCSKLDVGTRYHFRFGEVGIFITWSLQLLLNHKCISLKFTLKKLSTKMFQRLNVANLMLEPGTISDLEKLAFL